jgi:hypothetical protein
MDVNTILTNIRNVTLIGNTGAVSDTTKLVAYLNMAYRRIYDRVVREYPFFNQTTQDVVMTNGAGTLNPVPFLILSVYDTSNYQKLEPTDVLEEEERRPQLDEAASPDRYWLDGLSSVRSYPLSSTTLRVRYVPDIEDLTSTDTADAIIFPAMFHDLLVWETALIVAYDERDKIVGAELQYTEDRATEDWSRLKSFLRLRAPRVKPKVKMPVFHAY